MQNAITKRIKKFDLTSPQAIAKDGGTVAGSTSFTKEGMAFDRSTNYVTYNIPNTLFSSPKISFSVKFTPNFEADDDISHFLFDTTYDGTTNRYFISKHFANTIRITCGDLIIIIPLNNFQDYWRTGKRNVIVFSGESGDNNAWLNGHQILTNDTDAWTVKYPTELFIGAFYNSGFKFDGKIHSISIKNDITTAEEAQDLYDNSTFNFQNKASVYLDMEEQTVDGSGNAITKDKSGNGNHFKLGDGSDTDTFPDFKNPGFETDGSDYMQGTTTGFIDSSVSEYTVAVVLDWQRVDAAGSFLSYETLGISNFAFLMKASSSIFQFYAGSPGGNSAAKFNKHIKKGKVVIIGTADGSTTSIYVNGMKGEDASVPRSTTFMETQQLFGFIRGSLSTDTCPEGSGLYHASIFPFKLSPTQIRALTSQLKNKYS
jgi:hypothetical protein